MPATRGPGQKTDRLAALREARSKGGRLSQWKNDDADIYDEVTDEQYHSIVGSRLENDDFIVDDDGSGYVDNGADDWGRAESESEDEDDFEGEDEALRKARKAKRAKARAKAAKDGKGKDTRTKDKAGFSDYARPAQTGAYRPAPSNEEDFMASLLSTVTAEPSRKRKSSPPDYPSSDPVGATSDSGWSRSSKRWGDDSEDEVWDPMGGAMGKKPRISDATVVPHRRAPDSEDEDEPVDFDGGMDVDDDHVVVKTEPLDDDDDEVAIIKPAARPQTTRAGPRRRVNNSAAVRNLPAKPEREPEVEEEIVIKKPVVGSSRRPAPDRTAWQAVQEALAAPKVELDAVRVPQGSTKAENVLEADGSLRMFWLDYNEDNGVVHLIGKVLDRQSNKYVSACLSVKGIQRNLFVKPRAKRFSGGRETDMEVTRTDVYQDFDRLRSKHGIEEWSSKFVQRKYAFEDPTVEHGESEWMKVVYGFDQPEMGQGLSSQTFSHVFGTNTTAFELLALKRRIMGPCWLEVKGAELSAKAVSWCKIEFSVSDPKNVNPFSDDDESAPKDTPPLTFMSIALRTIVNHRENKTEILVASTRTWEGVNIEDPTPPDRQPSTLWTVVRPIEKFPPGLESRSKDPSSPFMPVKAERALLNALLATIQRHDPDVIVGHNFFGNAFESLLYRLKELKADNWSRIGRFRRKALNITKSGTNSRFICGRLVADLSSDAAKGMISSTTWSLTEMVSTQLGVAREDVDPEDTHTYFDSTVSNPDKLVQFIRLNAIDSYFQMAIASRVQLLPLTKQLSNLAGNHWNGTLNGGRASRNDFILLHEFHKLKYVCPDRAGFKSNKVKVINDDGEEEEVQVGFKRGKAKYAGGLVFEPKRGLCDTYIMVMDFNSLYPSIIQEYNIDFTTVERNYDDDEDPDKIPEIPPQDLPQGVLPRIIATLVQRRRQVKSLMKDKNASPARLQQWDIKQMALKLTANSMYGCLGFSGSRFYAQPLASLTTFKGREILTQTRELAESMSLDVVYGDTDSVFVNSNVTNYADAVKIANEFKRAVNERYRLLEIDLDAMFERLLLLNKKKYAAVKINEAGERTNEVKGLDMVRREFSKLSKDASAAVLKVIISGESTENVVIKIHELLTAIGESVRGGSIPIDDFIIFKRLGKDPEAYPDKKSQPHVQVALRMKAKGATVRAHDVIPYILCLGSDGKSSRSAQADHAFHPDDLRRAGSELKIDYDLYLDSQVLQPVLRMSENIEGTDRARLAECLGLDPQRYTTQTNQPAERAFFTLESQISDKERFKDASPLSLKCHACEAGFTFEGVAAAADGSDGVVTLHNGTGISCPACNTALPKASVHVQLETQIRAYISKYYLGWTVCDGDDCGARTRAMGVYGRRCLGFVRPDCKGSVSLEYTDTALYNQLLYLRTLFDADKALADARGSGRHENVRALTMGNTELLSEGVAVADRYLDKNGRRWVDLRGLFSFMGRMTLA